MNDGDCTDTVASEMRQHGMKAVLISMATQQNF